MEFDPNKDEVIKLLTTLKSSNGAYPPELLAARKARYLQQVAQVGIAAGTGMGIKQMLKGGNGAGISPAAGTLLEMVLVVAIVAEAGTLGYFYRDKLAELLNLVLGKPKVEQTANPPVDNSSPVIQVESTASPALTETPPGTPSPVIVINGTVVAPSGVVSPVDPANPVVNTAVNPVIVPTDRNGNQYGHTPIPERTKDPNGGNNGGNGNDTGSNSDTNGGGNTNGNNDNNRP
jgi:hypothetical protein